MLSIETATEWVAHAAGAIGVGGWTGAALGLGFGCVYGVDGWRGSVKEVDFKHSPRVKNLLWAVTILAGTLLGDKFMAADRPWVTFAYLAAFLLAAGGTVLAMGAVIYFQARSQVATQKVPPLTDYFYWGYAYYSKKLEEFAAQAQDVASQRDRQLLVANARHLSNSFATVAVTLRSTGQVPLVQLKNLAQTTLQAVCAMIRFGCPEDRINANYMMVYGRSELSASLRESVRFGGKAASVHETFLVLAADAYAEHEEREAFALPVHSPGAEGAGPRVLPGAPKAFSHDKPEIIDDTAKITFGDKVEKEVRRKINAYFATKSFKSFASIPIVGGSGRTIGILNVESSGRCVLGKSQAEKSHMATLLRPYCVILGLILAETTHECCPVAGILSGWKAAAESFGVIVWEMRKWGQG